MDAPEKTAANERFDTSQIKGWGVDIDPDNDLTYPYRDRSRDPGLRSDWERPALQSEGPEILQSVEHLRRPAVFGTASPPRGVSGMIRRAAFRWSESNWIHWLLLMGADRIDVFEGVAEDVGRGIVPNIPAEMGARAEWRHNKKGFAIKATLLVAASGGLLFWLSSRGRKRR